MRRVLGSGKMRLNNPNISDIVNKFKLNDHVAWEMGGYVYTGEISRVKYAGEHSGIRIESHHPLSLGDAGVGTGAVIEDVFIPPSKLHLVRLVSRDD